MRKFQWLMWTAVLLAGSVPSYAEHHENQRAVLITGATTGIGRMAAEHLASNGHFVYAGARKDKDIAELNKIDNIRAVRLDVTVQDDIDAAVARIRAEGRGLWGLVNNAGVNVVGPLIEFSDEDFDFLFDVNVRGVFSVTKAFAPLIIESQGRIVNISSISGIGTGSPYGPYSMTKHAVEAFNDALAEEMDTVGVKVAAIEPGNYRSEIGMSRCRRMLAQEKASDSEYWAEMMQRFLDDCKNRLETGISSTAPEPVAVARAIEHALFADEPREHYLVVPEKGEAGWVTWTLISELLDLNLDAEHGFTRDEIVDILDREIDFRAGNEDAFKDLLE